MKRQALIFLMVVISTIKVFAQALSPDKVPAAVTSAFNSKFPETSHVYWFIKNKNVFGVEFSVQKLRISAEYDKKGNWLKTQFTIQLSELPDAISQTISKKFQNYKLIGVYQSTTAAKGKIYVVGASKDGKKYWLRFAPTGKLLSKEEFDEDD